MLDIPIISSLILSQNKIWFLNFDLTYYSQQIYDEIEKNNYQVLLTRFVKDGNKLHLLYTHHKDEEFFPHMFIHFLGDPNPYLITPIIIKDTVFYKAEIL